MSTIDSYKLHLSPISRASFYIYSIRNITMTPTKPHPPISQLIPPLSLGTATFNNQYNPSPHTLPTLPIINHALNSGIFSFDTSPYYGPAESLLGAALTHPSITSTFPRQSYFLTTKVGRISADVFDYSPAWIEKSIDRSITRLHGPLNGDPKGKDKDRYIDLVLLHDVEFVSPSEVLTAIKTLRTFRTSGKIKFIGISGYPVSTLLSLSQKIYLETGEPLDAIMSYANFTLQNTLLESHLSSFSTSAKVDVILNASPLGMGLLRNSGVPVGSLGDWHPAPHGLRDGVAKAVKYLQDSHGELDLARVAVRFAMEEWIDVAAKAGLGTSVPFGKRLDQLDLTNIDKNTSTITPTQRGINVCGCSYLNELTETIEVYKSILSISSPSPQPALTLRAQNKELAKQFREILGKEWIDYTWASPGEGFTRGVHVPED